MKSSTKEALDRYLAKQAEELKPKKKRIKRNRQPEKEVAKECVAWVSAHGWSVDIYEAKATYDPRRGVWRNQSMKAGTCDLQGADAEGRAVCIEFKAPGRLPTFNQPKNYRQKEYLITKINNNAFGCVVDSLDLLKTIYAGYCQALTISKDEAKVFLLKNLP